VVGGARRAGLIPQQRLEGAGDTGDAVGSGRREGAGEGGVGEGDVGEGGVNQGVGEGGVGEGEVCGRGHVHGDARVAHQQVWREPRPANALCHVTSPRSGGV
jgi:hypothetical protein